MSWRGMPRGSAALPGAGFPVRWGRRGRWALARGNHRRGAGGTLCGGPEQEECGEEDGQASCAYLALESGLGGGDSCSAGEALAGSGDSEGALPGEGESGDAAVSSGHGVVIPFIKSRAGA